MRGEIAVGATLVSCVSNAKGVRVASSDGGSIGGDDRGKCDVNEDVRVVRGAKEASEIGTPVRRVGTMTLVPGTT